MKARSFGGVITIILALVALAAPALAAPYRALIQGNSQLPLTTFNITFRTGSADDPKGQEGVADLTGQLLREGGVLALGGRPALTRAALEDYLFPFAADIGVMVGKEQTTIRATAAAADAERIFDVLAQLVVAPAFDEKEFQRLKGEALDALTKQWPREDQEELGKAALDRRIFGAGYPYSHVVTGRVKAVDELSLEKVKTFYSTHYTRRRLTAGAAGVISPGLARKIKTAFAALPEGAADRAALPRPAAPTQMRMLLVKGPFDATGVHLGQPLGARRGEAAFAGLYLASAAFGKHRSFVGRLMHAVREVRSLNYGDYSYVEDFPHGGHHLIEPTQAARTWQAFTVWGRPTTLPNGCFLLRQLARETRGLAEQGLTAAEFKIGQSHLVGYVPLLATGIERRLGYAIDAEFYGIKGDYLSGLQSQLKKATRAGVNQLLKKHLHPEAMEVVVVTPDPEQFKRQILGERCDVQYGEGGAKAPAVLAEDKEIAVFRIGLDAKNIEVVDAEDLFE